MAEKYKIGDQLKALYLTNDWKNASFVEVVGHIPVSEEEAEELRMVGVEVNAGDIYYDCTDIPKRERTFPLPENRLRPQ